MLHLLQADPDRHPGIAPCHDALEDPTGRNRPQDNGRMRLLGWLRERADGGKIIILPVVLGLLLGPEGLHRHDGLLGLRPAVREVASHDLRLLFEPACSYAKEKPATGEVIECGDLLGQEERVALWDQTNPCPELDRLR